MHELNRRSFCSSCAAWVGVSLAALPAAGRLAAASGRRPTGDDSDVVIEKPFGRVEQLADGVFAVVADFTGGNELVSNGGIIAGRDAVLVVEAFMTPGGSRFVAEAARELTGRAPTHVVVTHFHGDHTAGLSGYLSGTTAPKLVSTDVTRDSLLEQYESSMTDAEAGTVEAPLRTGPTRVLPDTILPVANGAVELDLGGRTVRLTPKSGHTSSDVTIELLEPRVTWCGDLVFNGLFPFYGDAIPSALGESCHGLLKDDEVTYVPGHGAVATAQDLVPYLGLLDEVEAAARDAHAKGIGAEEAWKRFEIPARLGEWSKFRPDIFRFAFEAWERELGNS